MITYILILFIVFPDGSTDMVLEKVYPTQQACQENAALWGWNTVKGGYVKKAICWKD